ncbi:MAG TPA: hypothetical protein VF159_08235 [Gemmatimonadaceae bacterium]|nr:hypothetical protein [Vicinamibacterales bacterium]
MTLLIAGMLVLGIAPTLVTAPVDPRTIDVPANGDLQAALDAARPGDVVALAPGAIYTGNFVLPASAGDGPITLRTGGEPAVGADVRMTPARAASLAKLQSPNRQPVLRTAPGAHQWQLVLLEFRGNANGVGDILLLGDGSSRQRNADNIPRGLVVDRCYIHGDRQVGQKRGIALNSANTAIRNSYISDIKSRGQDSQAIAGWNGPGPYTIENNYLEAAGENILFGGADPAVSGLVPSDIVIRHNQLTKPEEWRQQGWVVKNDLELKNARRVLVEENLIEYSWVDGQAGYAVLFTPRNQDGACTWCTVEDVTFRRNLVRHAGGGVSITGSDDVHPSGPARRLRIEGNLFYDIDNRWGGRGMFLLVGNGPTDVKVLHNTVIQGGNIVEAYGGSKRQPQPILGFEFRDNLVLNNKYGVHGSDRASGLDTLDVYFPGSAFATNGIGGGNAKLYPPSNQIVPRQEFLSQFVDPANGNYGLKPGSRFAGAASDGSDLGADVQAVYGAIGLRPRPASTR